MKDRKMKDRKMLTYLNPTETTKITKDTKKKQKTERCGTEKYSQPDCCSTVSMAVMSNAIFLSFIFLSCLCFSLCPLW